jgi:hypothetical protein
MQAVQRLDPGCFRVSLVNLATSPALVRLVSDALVTYSGVQKEAQG